MLCEMQGREAAMGKDKDGGMRDMVCPTEGVSSR